MKITEAPQWLIDICGKPAERDFESAAAPTNIDQDRAAKRAITYLETEAPTANEGDGGDTVTYAVAARVMDFGCSCNLALNLMLDHWNDRCSPPWDVDELESKVANAARYRTSQVGSGAPEVDFADVEIDEHENHPSHPVQRMNETHAFVVAGNGHHVLWETQGPDDDEELRHLGEGTFHKLYAARTMRVGDKQRQVSELWIMSKHRRSYKGLVFRPEKETPSEYYNLWRGFAVAPAEGPTIGDNKRAVDLFLEHVLHNVCKHDKHLANWLLGYFAHMIQKPWEKPLVALCFKGGKGTGKNALIERVGALLGCHFMVTSNRRYLVGQFNCHMENLLMFVLDEAFWSGDKQGEGQLKDLVTGTHHVIEPKGQATYKVENLVRVVIIGNEDWLVPASHDERRFAVFSVGDERKQDKEFFIEMKVLMEQGGYAHLLRYLMDFDISKIDVNQAPSTEALLDQKLMSLEPIQRWWFDCLRTEVIRESEFGNVWPDDILTDTLRKACQRYCQLSNIRTWSPNDKEFGRALSTMAPSIKRKRKADGYIYQLPSVEALRIEFGKFIGHDVDWS